MGTLNVGVTWICWDVVPPWIFFTLRLLLLAIASCPHETLQSHMLITDLWPYIIFTWAPANFTWAQVWVCLCVATYATGYIFNNIGELSCYKSWINWAKKFAECPGPRSCKVTHCAGCVLATFISCPGMGWLRKGKYLVREKAKLDLPGHLPCCSAVSQARPIPLIAFSMPHATYWKRLALHGMGLAWETSCSGPRGLTLFYS